MGAMLEAALNGDREGDAVPRTPQELAREGAAAVRAGARALHFHPYDEDGHETLEAGPCAAALRAVREAVGPGIALSLSTSAAIEADPARRAALVAGWAELPDLVSANQGEEGIAALCEALLDRGVGIEAGLLSRDDALRFAHSGLVSRCARALVEPLEPDEADALAGAAEIEAVLLAAEIGLEQVHHGDGITSWAVARRAIPLGHGIRTGLEDTPLLPDGSVASGNAELVAAAARMLGGGRLGGPTPERCPHRRPAECSGA
jgi:uncharacterized protein (DUF849 family)